MIGELMAALKAIPHIVQALNRLTDATTAMAATKRRKEKDELLSDLIDSARSRREQRLLDGEAERVSGDSGGES
jgi:hypothetical protein|tara:strand:- start:5 stop:226 length:222 start_codon:yes stop_codon:yes gene_type:complete